MNKFACTLAAAVPSCALALALASVPLRGQTTAAATAPASADQAAAGTTAPTSPEEEAVVLSPFEVKTDQDNGYAATNEISGSRISEPLKDVPLPIDVITSQFISDTGATDLRSALQYESTIMLETQNDLENNGSSYANLLGGGAYGPGGVNNPQGLTSDPDEVQLKVRGFVTVNTLRDGFLREAPSDAVNIDRIEVVYGPNALLYGVGNFGGVVDYLTKQPQDVASSSMDFQFGTYDFLRAELQSTGPISTSAHLDYRLSAAWERSDTNIQYQKNGHYFIAPSLLWKPTPTTQVYVDTEYFNGFQKGYSAQFFRAAEGNGSTPVNNDQLEAVSFYYPPGSNPRTTNLSGPDTYADTQESNIELKATQRLLVETDVVPELDGLLGYNHSSTNFQLQNINGEISGPISPGFPGYDLSQTITLTTANSLGGQGENNGNLLPGTFPNEVVEYGWVQHTNDQYRDQERAELTALKTLFPGRWFQLNDSILAGYSEIFEQITQDNWETTPGDYDYVAPNATTPILFGTQGDGAPDAPMLQNDLNNISKTWDAGYYLNNYMKLFNGRVILMNGIRHDKLDEWTTDTQLPTSAGGAATTTTSYSPSIAGKSYQNGVEIEITKNISIYGLKAEGLEPATPGLHNAVTGGPVTANYAKSREEGIKFEFLDGKISGRISHYVITKTTWATEPWYAPAPMGHPRFNPNAPIVYELSGGFNCEGVAGATQFPNFPAGQGAPVQTEPAVISAWNAAASAGALYELPNEPGRLYLNASNPAGAAYLDTAFAANQASGGAWPGWLYQGDSNQDPNINNATMDAAGFYNTPLNPAFQVIDQSHGVDGEVLISPTSQLQIVFNYTLDQIVQRLNLGEWPQYPYPQDRWAVWYFQNGSFGLDGEPLNVAYTNPQNTATRTNAGVFPGDDSPKYAYDFFVNYKFAGDLTGWSVGVGGQWHSQEEVFSGVTHGGQEIEQNAAGQTIILYSPSEFLADLMLKYEWKSWGHLQYAQVNVDNALDNQKLYGLIYQSPLTAKFTYGVRF